MQRPAKLKVPKKQQNKSKPKADGGARKNHSAPGAAVRPSKKPRHNDGPGRGGNRHAHQGRGGRGARIGGGRHSGVRRPVRTWLCTKTIPSGLPNRGRLCCEVINNKPPNAIIEGNRCPRCRRHQNVF